MLFWNTRRTRVSWHNPEDILFRDLIKGIHQRYNIKVEMYKEPNINDPYDFNYVVYWEQHKINISNRLIGPSRIRDFHVNFFNEIKKCYPEMLL